MAESNRSPGVHVLRASGPYSYPKDFEYTLEAMQALGYQIPESLKAPGIRVLELLGPNTYLFDLNTPEALRAIQQDPLTESLDPFQPKIEGDMQSHVSMLFFDEPSRQAAQKTLEDRGYQIHSSRYAQLFIKGSPELRALLPSLKRLIWAEGNPKLWLLWTNLYPHSEPK